MHTVDPEQARVEAAALLEVWAIDYLLRYIFGFSPDACAIPTHTPCTQCSRISYENRININHICYVGKDYYEGQKRSPLLKYFLVRCTELSHMEVKTGQSVEKW